VQAKIIVLRVFARVVLFEGHGHNLLGSHGGVHKEGTVGDINIQGATKHTHHALVFRVGVGVKREALEEEEGNDSIIGAQRRGKGGVLTFRLRKNFWVSKVPSLRFFCRISWRLSGCSKKDSGNN